MVWPREAAIVQRLMDLGVSHATQVTRKGSKIDDACDLVWFAFDPRSYLVRFSIFFGTETSHFWSGDKRPSAFFLRGLPPA